MKCFLKVMKSYLILLLSLGWACLQTAQAQFFNQDFNISTTVGDYEAGTPNIRQFDEIRTTGSVASSIASNRLQFARTGNGTGNILRRTDIEAGTSTNAIMVRFDVNQLSGSDASNRTATQFQFGTSFNNGNSAETGSNLFAQFFIHNSNNFRS